MFVLLVAKNSLLGTKIQILVLSGAIGGFHSLCSSFNCIYAQARIELKYLSCKEFIIGNTFLILVLSGVLGIFPWLGQFLKLYLCISAHRVEIKYHARRAKVSARHNSSARVYTIQVSSYSETVL